MARKPKLTQELIEQASKLIEAGNYQRHVAMAIGVSEETWYRWLREGEQSTDPKNLKRQFYEAIKKAEGRAIARNVALIQKAAQDGNWQASAWWLERRYPEEFGRRERIAFDNEPKLNIRIELVDNDKEANSSGD